VHGISRTMVQTRVVT